MKLDGTIIVDAPQEEVWQSLMDPAQLAKIVPGCEKAEQIDATHYDAVMSVKVQFMTIRSKAHGTLLETDPPRHLTAELVGEPIAMAGAFRARLTLDLQAIEEQKTQLQYIMDLSLLGRLASLGEAIARSTSQRLSKQFVENVAQLFSIADKSS